MENNKLEEIQKCIDNPYYFATKYLKIDNKTFTTKLSEEEFNKQFKFLERVIKMRNKIVYIKSRDKL